MILSKEFYDRCCPSYKNAVDELEQKLTDIRNHKADKKSHAKRIYHEIIEFSKRYLTPKQYWDECIRALKLSYGDDKNWRKRGFYVARRAYFHYHDDFWEDDICYPGGFRDKHKESYTYRYIRLTESYKGSDSVIDVLSVSYPHSNLKHCFDSFEQQASRLPSKELVHRYEKMKALYPKIKAAEGDSKQWIDAMAEAGDCMFVKDNVEKRLGENYFDVKLWKLYLAYLKEHGCYQLLLETYSKYCRFFLDDHEMKEMYKRDLVEYGPVDVPWDNRCEFEKEMAKIEDVEVENIETKEIVPLDKKLCSTFYDTYQRQTFSFRHSFIAYILKNASHQVLRKLFSSCKYFFARQPTPICYRLYVNVDYYEDEIRFCDESLELHGPKNRELVPKNAYISGVIDFEWGEYIPNDLMSKIISRLHRCDAKYIDVQSQHLSFTELKFLIQHGGVVQLCTINCRLLDENGIDLELEAILDYLPNIEDLDLDNVKVTANTAQRLAKQKFNGKIHRFYLYDVYGEPFNLDEFLKFCIANRDDVFDMHFFFFKFDPDFVVNFKKMMNDYESSCENTYCDIGLDSDVL